VAWLRSLERYVRLGSRLEDDVDEEFRAHIEMRAEDLERTGLSRGEARRRARAEFGGMEKYKEEGRRARGAGFRGALLLDTVLSDLRYATRGLLKAKGSSLVAVLAIALGVGLPTVMYSVVHGVVDMELPFDDGERIVSVVESNRGGTLATAGEYLALRESQRSLENLAAYRTEAVTLRSVELAARYTGGVVTANMLDLLAVPPILGRGFEPSDDLPGAPLTVLIDRSVWEEQFGGDPGVLGRTVTLNGETGEVIGVMDDGWGLLFPSEQHVWTPLRLDVPASRGLVVLRNLDSDGYSPDLLIVVGKLREGVTVEQADTEIAALAASIREGSDDDPLSIAGVRPFTDAIMPNAPMMFYPLLAAVMPVLLIACANVANLLLARTAARSKDIAMRTAIGASRARAVSQVMAEAVVLSAVASVLATVIAWTGIDMVRRAFSAAAGFPSWLTVELDSQVLAFIAALAGLAAFISGAIPAWRATSADVGSALKDGSGALAGLRIGRLSRTLIVAEVAMSITLLVVAGQMIRGFVAITQRELPVPAADVFTARVAPLAQRYPDPAMRQLLWEDVEARVVAIPGVRSVGLATSLPALGSGSTPFIREGDTYATEREVPRARWSVVSSGFFATLGAAPVEGRTFVRGDSREATPVIVVNETFARRFLEGQPIGRRIRVGGLESDAPWREVVGVVPDLHMAGVANANPAAEAGFYVPLAQDDAMSPYLIATTSDSPLGITDAVRSAVSEADADTPVYSVATLRVLIDGDSENTAFSVFGMLFIVFGVAALFMAAAGLYAVTSFSVTRRVPELGLRMAVGASAAQVRRLVLAQGMRLVAIGAVLGAGLSGLVDMGPLSEIFGTGIWDPATYALVFAVLASAALLATALPARRATRVDPMIALRAS
jgi:predicted permease